MACQFLKPFPLGYIMFIRFVTFTYPCAICKRRSIRVTISICIVLQLNMYPTKQCSIEICVFVHIVMDI